MAARLLRLCTGLAALALAGCAGASMPTSPATAIGCASADGTTRRNAGTPLTAFASAGR